MKEYSLSDIRDKSATVIIAYTIRAMNNCGFSKMQVDRYIKMIKSLSYNELLDLSNSILSSCNDYIKDLYNDANEENNMDKKLEARIARLEKMLVKKNESKGGLTVGGLVDFLGQFDADKEVQFEMGNVLRPIDAGDIYDAGDSVNFDFTYIMQETSGW